MPQTAAPFQTTITYVRGRLVLVSRDGEGYGLSPDMLERMLDFFNLMLAWTHPQTLETTVGPFHCIPTGECTIKLPLEFADKSTALVPVAPDWLERMRPVFARALEIIRGSPEKPVPDFTLELRADGTIALLPPDRSTLRPA